MEKKKPTRKQLVDIVYSDFAATLFKFLEGKEVLEIMHSEEMQKNYKHYISLV